MVINKHTKELLNNIKSEEERERLILFLTKGKDYKGYEEVNKIINEGRKLQSTNKTSKFDDGI